MIPTPMIHPNPLYRNAPSPCPSPHCSGVFLYYDKITLLNWLDIYFICVHTCF